uniref:Uncharacterized protein n=1 Tax=Vitis vinifera TaxID=29760 RepID=F6GVY8_VITVI
MEGMRILSPQTLPGQVKKGIKGTGDGAMQGYGRMERSSDNGVRGDAT